VRLKFPQSFEKHWSIAMSHLNVQLPDSLYKNLQILAQQDGISVNQFIATAVAEKIAALTTETYLEDRAKQGSRERYEELLAKVPDVEPEPYDQLPPG
jgi:stress-induced morphogen